MLTKAEDSKTLTARLITVANKLVSNHFIIMIVSCVVPLAIIFATVNFVDIEKRLNPCYFDSREEVRL